MADSDYDRDDDRRRDDRDDDRPRRRRDDDAPPKKGGKGVIILVVVLGAVLLLCVAPCVGGWLWMQSWGEGLMRDAQAAADNQVKKISGGDMTAAYNGMSSSYKSSHPQAKFEEAMKAAKLTDVQSVVWDKPDDKQANSGGQGTIKLTGTATLKSGGTIPVSAMVRLLPDFKTWEVENVTSP